MAGFKTHVSVSAGLGVGYGLVGYACGLPTSTAVVAASLCAIGGMLPDMDGDTGVPVREIVPITAAVIPVLMLDIFKHLGLNREQIFIAVMCLYFLIRFGVGVPFKRLTRHRGMWHSIPAAINVGLICFLVCSYQDLGPRLFKSVAISLGFLSHLLLDEVWSVSWFRLKQSAGTAFKLFSRDRVWPNLLTYGILIGLGYFSFFFDSSFKEDYQAWRAGELKLNLKPDWKRFQFTSSEEIPTATLPQPSSAIEAALGSDPN